MRIRKVLMLFLCLLLPLAAMAEAPQLPEAICEDVQWAYMDIAVEDWCTMPESGQILVLARLPLERRLLVYAPQNGGWQRLMDVKNGVPQLLREASIGSIRKGEQWSTSPEDGEPMNSPAEGFCIVVLDEIGEAYEQTVTYFHHGDTYRLAQYSLVTTNFCDVEEERLVFWNIGDGLDAVLARTIETDIEQVDFYDLPGWYR